MKELSRQISWQALTAGLSADSASSNSPRGSTSAAWEKFNRIPHIIAMGLILIMFGAAPLAYRFTARIAEDGDPFTYAQYGKEILAGQRLYSDIYFDKGPLSTIGYAIPQVFFPRNYLAIGTFMGLVLIAESLILIWNFRSNPPAMVAITYFVIIFPLSAKPFAWLSTEHLSDLFVACNLVFAYVIARNRRFSLFQCFLVGLCTCAALNTRQTALLSGLVPMVSIAIWGRPFRRMLAGIGSAFAGGVVGMAAVLWLVSRIADLQGYLDALFLHPASYAGLGSAHDVWRLFAEDFPSPLATLAIVFAALGIFSRYPALAASAVVAGLLTIILPRRDFVHYLVGLFPFIALLIGIGLERHARTSAIFCWACCIFMVYVSYIPIRSTLHDAQLHPRELELAAVADHIDRVAPPSATLLVWGRLGAEPIDFASKLPLSSKYWILWMFQKVNAPLLPIPVKDIVAQYLANPPTVIAEDRDFVLNMERGTDVPEYDKQGFELGKALLRKFHYEVEDSFGGYDIAVLQNSTGSNTRPATTNPTIP